MIAHIAARCRAARRLVEHRRHLRRRRAGRGRATTPGPSGAGRVLAHPQVQLAVTETARGGILLKGIGVALQRRLGGHQRLRRPPRPAGHRHRSTSSPRSRRVVAQDHQADGLGGAQRRRPAGLRDAVAHPGRAVGVLARPRLAGDPRGARPTAAGDHGHRRLGLRAARPTRDPDPLVERRRRPDDAGRAVAGSTSRTRWPRHRPRSASGCRARPSSRGCASFRPDPEHNPGRMNFFSPRRRHRGHRPRPQRGRARGADRDHERRTAARARRLLLGLGAVGDRQDEPRRQPRGDGGARRRRRRDRAQGEVPARAHDRRARRAVPGRRRAGRRRRVPSYPTEVDGARRRWSRGPARRRRRR